MAQPRSLQWKATPQGTCPRVASSSVHRQSSSTCLRQPRRNSTYPPRQILQQLPTHAPHGTDRSADTSSLQTETSAPPLSAEQPHPPQAEIFLPLARLSRLE